VPKGYIGILERSLAVVVVLYLLCTVPYVAVEALRSDSSTFLSRFVPFPLVRAMEAVLTVTKDL
jgi:hypothetical protein